MSSCSLVLLYRELESLGHPGVKSCTALKPESTNQPNYWLNTLVEIQWDI